ncbi:MAG: DNA topoisomerase VI subunit B [Candidatus Aenigmarchaeota archaeon]|nr:DNA topoisomerase VI subunit B [Candidatus Aenigmarchaeota archaeon]
MAEYKEIAISEFFEKNKHLLGFDNPTKALVTMIKEAVDNSLDACEEAGIHPDIFVSIENVDGSNFRVSVEDNGPGIAPEHAPRVLGKLLCGSKFKSLGEAGIQSRGQQGIGISACVLYAQLTTGKPTHIETKTEDSRMYSFDMGLDTSRNTPIITNEKNSDVPKPHGLKVVLEMKGVYRKVKGVEDFLKYTSIANPHARIVFVDPEGTKKIFEKVTKELPKKPKPVQAHPYGVELGTLMKMLARTNSRTLFSFLMNDFSKVGGQSAKEICQKAGIDVQVRPNAISRDQAEKLLAAMQAVKLQRPSIDCLSPIGEEELMRGLKSEYPAEFVAACTRPVAVYRAIPFQVEVGLAYLKDAPQDTSSELIRFTNKVPLFYQQSECAIFKAVVKTPWKRYGVPQPSGSLPSAPLVIVVHMASVWVPFISEGKQAIASYPEIIKEIKLAVGEVGRKLQRHISAEKRKYARETRLKVFSKYGEEVAIALSNLTDRNREEILALINKEIEKRREP